MSHVRIYRVWLENEEVIKIFNATEKMMITLICRVSPLEVSTTSFDSETVWRYNPASTLNWLIKNATLKIKEKPYAEDMEYLSVEHYHSK